MDEVGDCDFDKYLLFNQEENMLGFINNQNYISKKVDEELGYNSYNLYFLVSHIDCDQAFIKDLNMLNNEEEELTGLSFAPDKSRNGESEFNKDEDDPNRLWCICRKPHGGRFMVCCDLCNEWFHGECIGVSRKQSREIELSTSLWFCPTCTDKRSETIETTQLAKKEYEQPTITLKNFSNTVSKNKDTTVECFNMECSVKVDNKSFCSDSCLTKHIIFSLDVLKVTNTIQFETSIKNLMHSNSIIPMINTNTKKCLPKNMCPKAIDLYNFISSNPHFVVHTPNIEKKLRVSSKPNDDNANKKKVLVRIRLKVVQSIKSLLNQRIDGTVNPSKLFQASQNIETKLFTMSQCNLSKKYFTCLENIIQKLNKLDNKQLNLIIDGAKDDLFSLYSENNNIKKSMDENKKIKLESNQYPDKQNNIIGTKTKSRIPATENTQNMPLNLIVSDSTNQHSNHIFDLNCKICTAVPKNNNYDIKKENTVKQNESIKLGEIEHSEEFMPADIDKNKKTLERKKRPKESRQNKNDEIDIDLSLVELKSQIMLNENKNSSVEITSDLSDSYVKSLTMNVYRRLILFKHNIKSIIIPQGKVKCSAAIDYIKQVIKSRKSENFLDSISILPFKCLKEHDSINLSEWHDNLANNKRWAVIKIPTLVDIVKDLYICSINEIKTFSQSLNLNFIDNDTLRDTSQLCFVIIWNKAITELIDDKKTKSIVSKEKRIKSKYQDFTKNEPMVTWKPEPSLTSSNVSQNIPENFEYFERILNARSTLNKLNIGNSNKPEFFSDDQNYHHQPTVYNRPFYHENKQYDNKTNNRLSDVQFLPHKRY